MSSEIIAYLGRHEQPHADGSCACSTIIVGAAVVRVVGRVTHGSLVCWEDPPDAEHQARIAEREAISDWEVTRGIER